MVHKLEKRELASYYRQRGFSYSEIAQLCGVAKSTVSNWLAAENYSQEIKQQNIVRAGRENAKRIQLLNKARAKERLSQQKQIEVAARTTYRNYRNNALFIAGVTLCMTQCNLADQSGLLRLSSKNVLQHRLFWRFATSYLGVTKSQIRFWLLLYTHHDKTVCEAHWTKQLKILSKQMYQSQTIQSTTKPSALHFGVGNTIIASAQLQKQVRTWTELLAKELIK